MNWLEFKQRMLQGPGLARWLAWKLRPTYNDGAPQPLAYQPQHAWSDGEFDGWLNIGPPTISTRIVKRRLGDHLAKNPTDAVRVLEIKTRSRVADISRFTPVLPGLTCEHCRERVACPFVDDPYNTGGDCLAMK